MIFRYEGAIANEQNLYLQIDAFLKEVIKNKNIYTGKVSSTKEERRKLGKLMDYVSEGKMNVLMICERLDISRAFYNKYLLNRALAGRLRPCK